MNDTSFTRVAQLPLAPLDAFGLAERVGTSRAAGDVDDTHTFRVCQSFGMRPDEETYRKFACPPIGTSVLRNVLQNNEVMSGW
jgi:predicted RNA-binding Zn-ribbon protein involved in translation (DUF1610 family)